MSITVALVGDASENVRRLAHALNYGEVVLAFSAGTEIGVELPLSGDTFTMDDGVVGGPQFFTLDDGGP